jgi:hypothetical protein
MAAGEEIQRIDEGTLEKIWSTLPNLICHRHRTLARNVRPTADNPRPTDWNIEEHRTEYYSSYADKDYFMRHLVELANRHPEIQVAGDVVRLTPQGLDYCEANIPNCQRDF